MTDQAEIRKREIVRCETTIHEALKTFHQQTGIIPFGVEFHIQRYEPNGVPVISIDDVSLVMPDHVDTWYEQKFIETFCEQSANAHTIAVEHGFWDKDRSDPETISLIHAELSEALEGYRNGNQVDEHVPTFNNVEVELGDAIIRIMDLAARRGYRVPEALIAKMEFNKSRPHKHGKTC